MEARVQYNDYVGTAAADFADSSSLEGYLKEKGVNTERYEPIGVKSFSSYTNYFNVRFICIDRQSEERKAIYIDFEKKDFAR